MDSGTLNEIRQKGEAFLKALNGELLDHLCGLKKESKLKEIYNSYRELGDYDLFFEMVKLSNEQERGFKLIRDFLARFTVESRFACFKDQILRIEAGEEITLDKKHIPYRAIIAEIKKEPLRVKREEMYIKRDSILTKLTPILIQIFETAHETSRELGFPDYLQLCAEIEELNLYELEKQARTLLNDTEYLYRDLLRWFLKKKMALKLTELKAYDLHYLLNSFELRENFPQIELKPLAEAFLKEMGLEIGKGILLDFEKRNTKTVNALCIPVEIPNKIVIVGYPIGGVYDYESFFHSLGVALYYRYKEPEDPFEFKRLGDSASVKVFGCLFRNLLFQPKWLKRYLQLKPGTDFLQFLCLKMISDVRYLSGKLLYELLLHRNNGFYNDKPDLYRQMLKEAMLCEYSKDEYLNDMDLFFRTATELKAYIMEAQLKTFLRERFDEEWWREKKAGDFIKRIWEEGSRLSSKDLSSMIGSGDIQTEPFLAFLQEFFR
jgi:hypothetical protein